MSFFRSLLLSGAAIAALAFAAAPAQAAGNPIQISQCFVTPPKAMSHQASGTQIVYVNRGTKTADAVTFAVGYRNAAMHYVRRITDYGTFSPGVPINHHFQLYNDVTYAGKQVQFCYPTMVKWADGTMWMAPS